LRLATALVRAWTSIYTWRLEPSVRDARRAEIESDLWEQIEGAEGRRTRSFEIVSRLVLGMPDDLRWMIEQRRPSRAAARLIVLLATASVVMLSIWWARASSAPMNAPAPPDAPAVRWLSVERQLPPPPPPPPPPLCRSANDPAPCTRWP
jgi:hypothetical protein